MSAHVLAPNVPLDLDVQFCDAIYDRTEGAPCVRFKGRANGEYGMLVLDYLSAIEALRAAELIPGEPKLPAGFGETVDFAELKLRHRALRLTRHVRTAPEGQGDGADTGDGGETLTIVPRDVRPRSQSSIYLECTDFVLEKVVPRYREHGIPVGDSAVAAMVHTNFINRMDRMGGRRE